ncbi:MAG: hypothetical protein F4X57_13680 [Chloroflexi bacterium]|nr:hypothetical protein [Chloroflexota bacterium]
MRYVLTIVEQLDRAATELATDHPINNRLALILIDNATELVLHRQCIDLLEMDNWASSVWKVHQAVSKGNSHHQFELSDDSKKSMMTKKQRVAAAGKSLHGKLKVLGQMGDLSPAERRFISVAHDYRNELYHVGLTHDDIVRAIAGHYYLLCCELFVRMENVGLWGPTITSDDRYTEVAKRYLPHRDGRVLPFGIKNEELAQKLRCALPDGIRNLATTLEGSARAAIKALMDNFDFLIQDNPFGADKDKVLELVQWQRDLTEAQENEGVDGSWLDPDYWASYIRVAATLEATWKHKHTAVPIQRWMRRAIAVGQASDPLIAMDLYQSLRNDMSYLEEAFESSALDLDGWIQREIDKARGK